MRNTQRRLRWAWKLWSLIRVFARCSVGSQGPIVSSCWQQRLIRLQMCRLIWVFAGHAHHFVGFVMLQHNCKIRHYTVFSELLYHCIIFYWIESKNHLHDIRATIWQNQQNDCAPSEDSDQPGHLPSLIRVFLCAQWVAQDPSFLHTDSEDSDQIWAHIMPFCWFCHVVAHI